MKYIYPKLPAAYCNPLFRIGGNGLANCLFVYAKAIILAQKTKSVIIAPTWFNISIGTYIRHQSDKRHYLGLINNEGEIDKFKKFYLLLTGKKTRSFDNFIDGDASVLVVEGIYDFFKPLLNYQVIVRNYILEHINKSLLNEINKFDFNETVAVHIRLGDFPESRRVPLDWYMRKIKEFGDRRRILIFSDGSDEELKLLLALPNTQRVYFGGAIQDIIAISRCSYLIGSDSSFSAWGAYLGQVPCSFYRLQFGQILLDPSKQEIEIPY